MEKERKELVKINDKQKQEINKVISQLRLQEDLIVELQQRQTDLENEIKDKDFKIKTLECDVAIFQALTEETERSTDKNNLMMERQSSYALPELR